MDLPQTQVNPESTRSQWSPRLPPGETPEAYRATALILSLSIVFGVINWLLFGTNLVQIASWIAQGALVFKLRHFSKTARQITLAWAVFGAVFAPIGLLMIGASWFRCVVSITAAWGFAASVGMLYLGDGQRRLSVVAVTTFVMTTVVIPMIVGLLVRYSPA